MRVSAPIPIALPDYGVLFAESAHAADFRMAERVDPYHKLLYVFDGRVSYREGRAATSTAAEAGSVLVVPSGTRHAITDEAPSVLLLLCLAPAMLGADTDLAELWRALQGVDQRCLRLSRPTRQRLEGMWRRAIVEQQYARLGSRAAVRALAAQTLVMLARLPPDQAASPAAARVAAVAREVEETFYEAWDVDRAAARAGLSRRRFTALFRAATGETFWDFLHRRRLDHAERLLRAGENTVVGVMFASGFNDLSHFYRLFRARFGLPPGQLARRDSS